MRILPVPDRLVLDPETLRAVGAEGLTVDPTNLYWARMLADGDVIEGPEHEHEALPAPEVEPEA